MTAGVKIKKTATGAGILSTLTVALLTGGLAQASTPSPPPVATSSSSASSPSTVADEEGDVVSERTVIDKGHVDAVSARMVNDTFRTLFKDDRDPHDIIWREPTSVIMHLTPQAKVTVPDPAGNLSFLGDPGDSFYMIPQTQDPNILWAGWSTEAFGPNDIQGTFSLSLDEVDGPGDLVMFGWSPFGQPIMKFDTRDGIPDTYHVGPYTHEHSNWVFTEEGVYRLTFTYQATLTSGREVTDAQVFTMAVGDIDPDSVRLPGEDDGSASPTASPTSGGDESGEPTDDPSGGASQSVGTSTRNADSDGNATDDQDNEPSGGETTSGGTTGGGPTTTAGDGTLAATGSDRVLPIAVTSAGLLVIGTGVLLGMGRRRNRHTHP